ncbi:hypothetical protein BKG76_03740 [Mycobacteroides franklinii]|uniref:WXG100 family type VII secretion target n=1 Tax=Mycobacteroides franklinii TaxID=948102 RepID=A0A1S1LEI3_9MYCO|nr:hypothetical protein [Mycobacteroides franklinii]OHU30840.1 hypothetical protein BKG76_03740 [Mycobacteroides franklinii]
MSKQVSAEDWYSKSHAEIYAAGQAFLSGYPETNRERFHKKAQDLREAMTNAMREIQNEVANHWHGKAAIAMQTKYSEFFDEVDKYATRIETFGDKLAPLPGPMEAARKIKPPMSPQEEQAHMKNFVAKGMGEAAARKAVDTQKAADEDHARWQMTGDFSQPVVDHGRGASIDDETTTPTGGGDIQTPNSTGGGGQNGGGSGGGQGAGGANNATDGLANKDTKPAYSDGSGNQSGQGQGAGSGSGSGSGGGSPQSGSGGGSGSGLGNALSGLGGGSDKTGSGLPLGSTTAAGYSSPSGSGSGTGTLSGPGALRGGAGVPGLGGGTGTNPAGIGGAGVRGGAMGMGGMGMAPMGGAHGHGSKGEEDDEHETPEFLINWDNGNELFGDLPKASPGVIGDWTEHERAEKQRRESEIRRYKSMGWNVDFGDER